jgi:NADH-quinone oxidoreductase subunit J
MLETILFYTISLALIIFALGVIASRSAIYSVLSLVAAMCMMAGLFILLKAFLVATILVLVYAGAILVLFLFVVMLIDVKKIKKLGTNVQNRLPLRYVLAVALAGVIFWQTFHVIQSIPVGHVTAVQGTTQAIGRLLFRNYLLPFELTSFLLLAAVVSVVVLAKKDGS